MSKDTQDWSEIYERNIQQCLKIIDGYDFSSLKLPPHIDQFVQELSCHHNCDPKVLFYTLLSVIGHYCEAVTVYNIEAKQSRPITVFEVLIAPSGVEKSKYINIISNACTTFEMYLYEKCYKKERNFGEPVIVKPNVEPYVQVGENKKRNTESYEKWVTDHGSIKQVYTTPALLNMMTSLNLYFLANEGDGMLQECSFWNPADTTADMKQGALIDCWDSNKIIKSTVTHGSKIIKDRTMSMCIASTGRRWPEMLKELSRIQRAGGLHERCTFFCFDVFGDAHNDCMTLTTEKQYYNNLYDELLCTATQNDHLKHSLVQVLCIIKLFDYRTLVWSRESFLFIQPRLNELKLNKKCSLLENPYLFRSKQQMAVRRRGAEHTVRYACLIQMFKNALYVLSIMDEKVVKSGNISEEFELEAKTIIINTFGSVLERQNSFHKNGVPIQPLEVDIESATSAVALVFSLLLPQCAILFNYGTDHDDKSYEQIVIDEEKMKMTKHQELTIRIEKFIINLNYCFFHKTCITSSHFRDRREMVNDVLNDLVTRDLLYCGDGERIFFETKRSSMVKTYLKFIPTTEDEPRFRDSLLELYNIQYEDYIKQFDQASLLPAKSSLTPFGRDYIRKPQYAPIMNKKYCFVTPDKQLNTSNDETDVAREETQLNRQDNDLRSLPLVDVNHHDQHELLTCNADKTIQHSSILGANQCIQTTKATDHILTIQENVVKDINDIQNRNLLLSSAVAIPRISTTPKTCAIATEQDENSVLLKKDEFYALQNQPTVSDDCDQTTLENVDLNTWHDRPLNVTTPEDVNNDHDDILTKNSELDGITDDLKQSSSEAAGQLDKILEATQNDQEKIVGKTMDINKKILAGKALLIPSIVLTKGLIGLHIRAPAKDINDALEYLVAEELLKKDKYLQARNHPIESYLKCLPKDFDNISNKYLLQRKLSEPQVTVDKYLDSLKTIKYATLVQCPTSILINVLQTPPYDQFQIDLSSKRKESDEDTNNESFINEEKRKKMKTSGENK